jgi:hypothetical protein
MVYDQFSRKAFLFGTAAMALTVLGQGAALALQEDARATGGGDAPASYRDLYAQIVGSHSVDRVYSPVERLAVGDVALRLTHAAGDAAYSAQALAYFDAALADPKLDLRDFHGLLLFGRLASNLDAHRLLDASRLAHVNGIATEQAGIFIKSNDDGDYNIRIAQVLGAALLGAVVPDAKLRGAVRQKAEAYWQLIAATGDLDEDAENYDSFGAGLMVQLASLLGHEDALRSSANFRRMFERFRDVISPSGLMPEYGDAYFSFDVLLLDRIFLLETAAKLYDDPSFHWAAQLLYSRPTVALPGEDEFFRAPGLIDIDLFHMPLSPPNGPLSLVTYRRRRNTPGDLIDKMILRTGRSPGDSMALLDLYASGSHSHPELGPSIAYFESSYVPLFHNLGRRHVLSAACGNLPWAVPQNVTFPGTWNAAGEWHTMRIPVEKLAQADGKYVIGPSFSLRNFNESNHGCTSLAFDNLRLEGPAGTKLIDGFEDLAGWDKKTADLGKAAESDDRTEGGHAVKFDAWNKLPSSEFRRILPMPSLAPFTRDQYTHVCLDVKYTGEKPYVNVRGFGQWMDLGDQGLVCKIETADAQQQADGSARGRVAYSSYITPDTKLVRRFLLVKGGALVIADELTPGREMDGWTGGQLWQLYTMAAKGADWFCADDDGAYPTRAGTAKPLRMLVRYCTLGRDSADAQQINQWYYGSNPKKRAATSFFTTYRARKLAALRPELFTMVVLPMPTDADPESVAAKIGFQATSKGMAVTLPQVGQNSAGVHVI